MKTKIDDLNKKLEGLSPAKILIEIFDAFKGEKVISVSMQKEDIVLLDVMKQNNLNFRAYTLDTGRLHPETYLMIENVRYRYAETLEVYYPETSAIEKLLKEKGAFSFKESFENRKECCHIRKVEPNLRALKSASIWITGIRRDMSVERATTPILEFDKNLNLVKAAPLANFTSAMVDEYTKKHNLPVHKLYAQNFASIGCEPCTRAIEANEEERAGRWWWEQQSAKECGLHLK